MHEKGYLRNQHPFYIYNRVQTAVFNRITYLESIFSLSLDIHICPLKLLGYTPVRCVSENLNEEGLSLEGHWRKRKECEATGRAGTGLARDPSVLRTLPSLTRFDKFNEFGTKSDASAEVCASFWYLLFVWTNDITIIDSGERIRDLQQLRQRISAAVATTVTPDMFQHTRHQGRGRLEPGVGRGWLSALQRNQQHLGRLPFRTGFAYSNVNCIPLFYSHTLPFEKKTPPK